MQHVLLDDGPGPPTDALDGVGPLRLMRRRDRPRQVPLVPAPLVPGVLIELSTDPHLVEVHVGIHERGQEEPVPPVEHLPIGQARSGCGAGPDGADPVA